MARSCTVCRHPSAGAIAAALEDGRSARSLAAEFGVSDDAILRHKNHLARRSTITVMATRRSRSAASESAVPNDPLDELVDSLRARALAGDPAVIREYRLALAAQNARANAATPKVDLASEPEWIAFRTRMLDALEPYPAARIVIADALRGL